MRDIVKKLGVACLIGSLFLLGGCNAGSKVGNDTSSDTGSKVDKVAMGRYIEQEVDFKDMNESNQVFLNSRQDGKIQAYLYGKGGLMCYEQQEDSSFKQIEDSGIDAFNDIFNKEYVGSWITAVATDANNCIYVVCIGSQGGETDVLDSTKTRTYVIKIDEEGLQKTELVVEGELPYILPDQLVILNNGDCILSGDYTGIQRFSLETGNLVKNYAVGEAKVLVVGDKLFALNRAENTIDIYNLESHQLERSIACSQIDESSTLVLGEDGGDVYLISRNGIEHLVAGGSIWEKLAEGNGLSLGRPSAHIVGAAYKDEKFLVSFATGEFKEYVYSADTPSQPTTEITAYMLEESSSVREAIAAYGLAHPEVRINIQVGLSEGNGITWEDSIKALNAEILAGQGPDLLILDDLPIETYIEKGVLTDLGEVEEIKTLIPTMANCFEESGKIYAVPLRFTVPMLWGSQDVLAEVDHLGALADYQRSHPDERVLASLSSKSLLKNMVSSNLKYWFSEKGELQDAALIQFLEDIKTLAVDSQETVDNPREIENGLNMRCLLEMVFKDSQVYFMDADSLLNLLVGAVGNKEKGEGIFRVLKVDGKSIFNPQSVIGINKNSKKQELAMEIVAFILQEAQQITDTNEGFPVHKEAFNKWIQGETFNKDIFYSIGGEAGTLDIEWGHEEVLQEFYKEVEALEYGVMNQRMLVELILQGTEAYFKGNMSAKEAVAALKPQLELYMQE